MTELVDREVGCPSDLRLFWTAANHHACREGAAAARKWDSLGTVAMVVIVALVIQMTEYSASRLEPSSRNSLSAPP
jgi:hypothetical protein